MSVSMVLLAAGKASRFGSAKQCVRIDGVSLVRRAACAALATGADLAVVTGAYADEVAIELAGLSLSVLHNPQWEQGMGGSIARGFQHFLLTATSSAAIVVLADQPRVGTAQLHALISAHEQAPDRIIASDHGTTLGPPCLFPRRYYARLAALSGARGARYLLEQHAGEVLAIAMPEAALDIDTPEDFARLLKTASDADYADERGSN